MHRRCLHLTSFTQGGRTGINKYFSILDDDEIQDLYKIYEDDFVLFGYKFEYRGLKLNIS